MKDERGVTLVELLAATAIMSVILVSVITIIMNSTSETAVQGKESQMLYFAQQLMEEVRHGSISFPAVGECSTAEGCKPSVNDPEATYTILVSQYGGSSLFSQVTVRVSSSLVERPVELTTVVRN